MRSRIKRHIGFLLQPAAPKTPQVRRAMAKMGAREIPEVAAAGEPYSPADGATTEDGEKLHIPPELSSHQYVILLLHIAAEIEHALMVEYLYAAYTLGGPQVPVEYQAKVAQWQEIILGVAKEEMGHLMTVQNLLRSIGGPLNLDREDYPWEFDLYPFPFRLEPLTRASLAKYVVAESPEDWSGKEADEIRKLAQSDVPGEVRLHRVGELYALLLKLMKHPDVIPDARFRPETYPYQANWDEWGRGYRGGARGNSQGGAMAATPDVLLIPVGSRDEAVDALTKISTQGEACPDADPDTPSHFARFLGILADYPAEDAGWSPTRPAPVDPYVSTDLTGDGGMTQSDGEEITHQEAKLWGHLSNIRYQLLLTCLLHSFDFPGNLAESSRSSPRGLLIHAAFGEMYHLRSMAMMLVQTPLAEGSDKVAGPPFQMPYTLALPMDPVDRWRLHLDLLEASDCLVTSLLASAPAERHRYLHALREADAGVAEAIRGIVARETRL